ncbi:MAG: 50S ribosomal protein L4 [Candidatus Latescibacteria bacterium]|nr:50S ribosomal protein L4 [Candidatus Latescibacterota bacterium]
MANAKVYDFKGGAAGEVALPAGLFECEVNRDVLYEVVRAYLANQRSGTASVKGRSDVNFSKKKPYRQKGTGRARAGARSSPIWRKGGVAFGPRPRDYRINVPRKMKRKALKSALSDKGYENSVVVVKNLGMEEPRTRVFTEFLKSAELEGRKILLAVDKYDENIYKSVRNIPGIKYILGRNLNAYDILNAEVLMLTDQTVTSLEEVFA